MITSLLLYIVTGWVMPDFLVFPTRPFCVTRGGGEFAHGWICARVEVVSPRRFAHDVICARSVWSWTCSFSELSHAHCNEGGFLSMRVRVSIRMLQLAHWLSVSIRMRQLEHWLSARDMCSSLYWETSIGPHGGLWLGSIPNC
jgi:hypothetical protein